MDEQAWLQKGQEILSDIKEGRQAHPKATFVEIEDEIHKRMMQWEAQVLQETAQDSHSREWAGAPAEDQPHCPKCKAPLQARGKHQRTLQGNGGQSVTLHRTYGTCPTCGESFFPSWWGIKPSARQSGTTTTRASRPFGKLDALAWAVRTLEHLLGVQVSEETARRLTEQAGARVEAAQTAQAKAPLQEEPKAKPAPARLAISADGACVPLLHGEWAEVRTAAIGEVEAHTTAEGKQEVHVGQLSYFSRLTDAETFADLAEVEMRRRQVIQAEQVCAVTDGADCLQGFLDLHRCDAVRILDFPHAAEHVSSLLEALEKMGHHFPIQMLERCLHVLKHRGPTPLLRMSLRLSPELTEQGGVREHLGYLRKREALMQYPQFRRQGWPIGSDMVESANKLVVQARLKGAGMQWERSHVNPLLALRNGVCNQRWQETWQLAVAHQHAQHVQSRTTRAEHRKQAKLSSVEPLPVEALAPPCHPTPTQQASARVPPTPAATLPGSCRPSAYHPWKRGRACTPKVRAKM